MGLKSAVTFPPIQLQMLLEFQNFLPPFGLQVSVMAANLNSGLHTLYSKLDQYYLDMLDVISDVIICLDLERSACLKGSVFLMYLVSSVTLPFMFLFFCLFERFWG